MIIKIIVAGLFLTAELMAFYSEWKSAQSKDRSFLAINTAFFFLFLMPAAYGFITETWEWVILGLVGVIACHLVYFRRVKKEGIDRNFIVNNVDDAEVFKQKMVDIKKSRENTVKSNYR